MKRLRIGLGLFCALWIAGTAMPRAGETVTVGTDTGTGNELRRATAGLTMSGNVINFNLGGAGGIVTLDAAKGSITNYNSSLSPYANDTQPISGAGNFDPRYTNGSLQSADYYSADFASISGITQVQGGAGFNSGLFSFAAGMYYGDTWQSDSIKALLVDRYSFNGMTFSSGNATRGTVANNMMEVYKQNDGDPDGTIALTYLEGNGGALGTSTTWTRYYKVGSADLKIVEHGGGVRFNIGNGVSDAITFTSDNTVAPAISIPAGVTFSRNTAFDNGGAVYTNWHVTRGKSDQPYQFIGEQIFGWAEFGDDVSFYQNTATTGMGGAVYVRVGTNADNGRDKERLWVGNNARFVQNRAGASGGALATGAAMADGGQYSYHAASIRVGSGAYFYQNSAGVSGGGAYTADVITIGETRNDVLVADLTAVGNTATLTGGVFATGTGGSVIVGSNADFYRNQAGTAGAIWSGTGATFGDKAIFTENRATLGGGGAVMAGSIYFNGRVTLEGNVAAGDGGALSTPSASGASMVRFSWNENGGATDRQDNDPEDHLNNTLSDPLRARIYMNGITTLGGVTYNARNGGAIFTSFTLPGSTNPTNKSIYFDAIDGYSYNNVTYAGTEVSDFKVSTSGGAFYVTHGLVDMSTSNDILFARNEAVLTGGAIHTDEGDVLMGNRVRITDNKTGTAGGAFYTGRNVVVGENVFMSNNTADRWGGAIYSRGNVTFGKWATIDNNTSKGINATNLDSLKTGGGAIVALGSVTLGEGASVYGNVSTSATTIKGNGGAIAAGESVNLRGSTYFTGNSTEGLGGAIYIDGVNTVKTSTFNADTGDILFFGNTSTNTGNVVGADGVAGTALANTALYMNRNTKLVLTGANNTFFANAVDSGSIGGNYIVKQGSGFVDFSAAKNVINAKNLEAAAAFKAVSVQGGALRISGAANSVVVLTNNPNTVFEVAAGGKLSGQGIWELKGTNGGFSVKGTISADGFTYNPSNTAARTDKRDTESVGWLQGFVTDRTIKVNGTTTQTIGTLSFAGGDVTFDGATIAVDIVGSTNVAGTNNDLINVTAGAVTFSGTDNTIAITGTPSGDYKILDITDNANSISGNAGDIKITGGPASNPRGNYKAYFTADGGGAAVTVNGKELWISAGSTAPSQIMTWKNTPKGDMIWHVDDQHSNWVGETGHTDLVDFFPGDVALFDGAGTGTVTVATTIDTKGMIVKSGAYTFVAGAAGVSINGSGNTDGTPSADYTAAANRKLTVSGGSATFKMKADFAAGISVSGGALVVAEGGELATTTAPIALTNTGILRVAHSGAKLNSSVIALNGDDTQFQLSHTSGSYTLNNKVQGGAAGTGRVVQNGAGGTVAINNDLNKDTTVNYTATAGTTHLGANGIWGGSFTLGSNGTLTSDDSSTTRIKGAASLGGTVNPTGTLAFGSTVKFTTGAVVKMNGATSDKITAAGNITTDLSGGNSVTVFDLSGMTSGKEYLILASSGGVVDKDFESSTFMKDGSLVVSGSGRIEVISEVRVSADGGGGQTAAGVDGKSFVVVMNAYNKIMVWQAGSASWDMMPTGSDRWLNTDHATSGPFRSFMGGDKAVFSNTGSNVIDLAMDIVASEMEVSGTGNYTFTGSKKLTVDGATAENLKDSDGTAMDGSLLKTGTGTLTFDMSGGASSLVHFKGNADIQGGSFVLGNTTHFKTDKNFTASDSSVTLGSDANLTSTGKFTMSDGALTLGSDAVLTTGDMSLTKVAAVFGDKASATVGALKVNDSTVTLGLASQIKAKSFALDSDSELIVNGMLASSSGGGTISAGRISVTGSATVDGKLTARISNMDDFNTLITSVTGRVSAVVISAGSMNMTTAEDLRSGDQAGYTWIFKQVGNNVELQIAGKVKGFADYGGSQNTKNMASAVDKYVAECADAGKNPFKDDALGRLFLNATSADNTLMAQRILGQASGAIAAGGSQIAGSSKSVTADWVRHWAMDSIEFDEMNIPDAAVANPDNLGRHAPEYAFSPWRVHAEGLGAWGTQDGTGSDPDYDDRVYGGGMAIDRILGDRVRLGVSATFLQGKQKWSQNGSEVKGDSIFGTLYGRYEADLWFVTGQAFYGKTDVESTRRVSVYNPSLASIAVDETMRADYSTHTYGLEGLVGTDYELGAWTLSPGARLSFSRLESPNFTEKGGDGLQQRIGNNDRDSLELAGLINLTRSYALSGTQSLTPRLSAGLSYEFLDTTTSFDTSFIAYPDIPTWTSYSPDMGSVTFNVGVGIDYRLNDRIAFFVDYQGAFQSNYRRHTGYVGARASF